MVELHLTNGTTCAAAEVCPQVVTADVLMDGLLELCPQAVTANGQRTIPLAPPTAAELGVAKGMLLSNFSRADGRMIHCEFTAADLCELTTQVPACEASATDGVSSAADGLDAQPWDKSMGFMLSHLTFDFAAFESDTRLVATGEAAQAAVTSTFVERGFVLLENAPTATDTRLLHRVANLLGSYVRETNYGPVYEVRSEAKQNNLTNTALGLDPHTDNPYRDPVPTVQILSCISNEAEGGATMLVDGFAAAEHFRRTDPVGFRTLTRVPRVFRFYDDGVRLRASQPIIELSADGSVTRLAFNERSMAPLRSSR